LERLELEPTFRDRAHAGRVLGKRVAEAVRDRSALVLGLPRGGVPVAFEVAQVLGAELDIFLVRKLGLPGQEELAIGAIASGGVRILNESLISELQLSLQIIDRITAREERELKRREELFRQGKPPIAVQGRAIILVDDGLATGQV